MANNLFSQLIRASDIVLTPAPEPLWFGLYSGAVTLLNGETGIGKSSLVYNIALNAALGMPLWGVPFGLGRPLRVLYLDPENSVARSTRLFNLASDLPETLLFHDAHGVLLNDPQAFANLRDVVRTEKIDLLILDPLANLFGTKDENSNAEASSQMRLLISLASETNCAILCVHHTGKMGEDSNVQTSQKYGRGASARLASARAGLVFVAKKSIVQNDDLSSIPTPRQDVCRLQVTKDGIGSFQNTSIYLRMKGNDQFERVDSAEWKRAESHQKDQPSKREQVIGAIRAALKGRDWVLRTELLATLESAGHGKDAMASAINDLIAQGFVDQAHQGKGKPVSYRLNPEADEEDTWNLS